MLKQLKLEIALREAKKSLDALLNSQKSINERAMQLSTALKEAIDPEDIETINRQVTALEEERNGVDFEKEIKEKTEEIKRIEGELRKINEPAKPAKNITERDGNNTMNRRSLFYKLSQETRDRLVNTEESKTFLTEIREAMKSRSVTGADITVPSVYLSLVKENIDKYSKILPYINLVILSGDGKVPVMGTAPEGVWTDAVARFNERDIVFNLVDVGNNKVSGYIPVSNTWLEDSDIELAANILEALGKGIGKACDRAWLYGTGNNMPTGIITRLAQKAKPSDWSAKAPEWTNLSESHIKALDLATKSGEEFYGEIVDISAIPDDSYSDGDLIWIMSKKTSTTFKKKAIAFDSAAAIQARIDKEMPGAGGVIIEVSNDILPKGDVVCGYGSLYIAGERKAITLNKSEHAQFIEDNTVFTAKARYDGKPVFGEGFALFNIFNTAPATTTTFPAAEEAEG